jgi:hypothetical protein
VSWRGLLFWLLIGGCAGTETGNPSFNGSLGYDAYSSQKSVALLARPADDAELVTVVENAWLVLGDVGFVGQSDCAAGDHAEHVPGLGAGDHAATQAPATQFELEAGRYCGLSVPLKVDSALPSGAPPELAGRSILIKGQTRKGAEFRIASSQARELFLRSDPAGLELNEASGGLLIGFDVASWLGSLDLDSATPSADGVLVIDEDDNVALLTAFEQRVRAGVALFADRDRDGELDVGSVPVAKAE